MTRKKKAPKKPAAKKITKKVSPKTPASPADEPVDELVEGTPDERELAAQRAQVCANDLAKVLEHHRCRIMPIIRPDQVEPVGLDGNKVQITATYFVAPLP